MTEAELAEMEARWSDPLGPDVDVPALIAEVRRLRAELPNPTAGIAVIALQMQVAQLQAALAAATLATPPTPAAP